MRVPANGNPPCDQRVGVSAPVRGPAPYTYERVAALHPEEGLKRSNTRIYDNSILLDSSYFVSWIGRVGAEGPHRGTPGRAPFRVQLHFLFGAVPHQSKTPGLDDLVPYHSGVPIDLEVFSRPQCFVRVRSSSQPRSDVACVILRHILHQKKDMSSSAILFRGGRGRGYCFGRGHIGPRTNPILRMPTLSVDWFSMVSTLRKSLAELVTSSPDVAKRRKTSSLRQWGFSHNSAKLVRKVLFNVPRVSQARVEHTCFKNLLVSVCFVITSVEEEYQHQ